MVFATHILWSHFLILVVTPMIRPHKIRTLNNYILYNLFMCISAQRFDFSFSFVCGNRCFGIPAMKFSALIGFCCLSCLVGLVVEVRPQTFECFAFNRYDIYSVRTCCEHRGQRELKNEMNETIYWNLHCEFRHHWLGVLNLRWRQERKKIMSLRVLVSQCNIDVILFVWLWYCLCHFLCYRAAVSLKTLSCTL
jgi:hypothetical protein